MNQSPAFITENEARNQHSGKPHAENRFGIAELGAQPPNPKWDVVDNFLGAFYPDVNEQIHFRTFAPKSTEKNERGTATKLPDNIGGLREFRPANYTFTRNELLHDEEVQRTLVDANTYSGLYFVVNAGGTKNEEIQRINSFFCESDTLSIAEQHKLLDGFSLPTSCRLETGKSVHAYWLPTQDNDYTSDDFRGIQKRLIQHFDSDGSLHNPNRVMRVPTFNHVVWNHETGQLNYKNIELVHLDSKMRYSLEQMRAELPEKAAAEPKQPKVRAEKTQRPQTSLKKSEFLMPAFDTDGEFETWPALLEEARKRLMKLPKATISNGYVHAKGVCHNGVGNTAIHVNIDTGQFGCHAGCTTEEILEAVNLPRKPTAPERIQVVNAWADVGEFLKEDFPPVDEVMKYIERGTLSQFVATTNAGKTTLLLNASIALAAGKLFLPLVPKADNPRRVMYVDFETNKSKMHQTLTKMLWAEPYSWSEVRDLVERNMKVLVDTELAGLPLNLSIPEHMDYVEQEALDFGAELVIIDNTSSGFELRNENENSEVAKKVMLPLKNFAKRIDAATVLVHHTGKPGENSRNTVDPFMGRGASNYGSLSRTVYGLVPAKELGEGYVVLHNTKNKSGALLQPTTLVLDRDKQWFTQSGMNEPVKVTAETIYDFVFESGGASIPAITNYFLQFGVAERTISRRIKDAESLGLINRKNQRAKYEAQPHNLLKMAA